MKHVYVLCSAFLLATVMFAQQQGQPPPTTEPPYGTPQTFPDDRQNPQTTPQEPLPPGEPVPSPQTRPAEPMPPDEPAPPPHALASQEVEQQITTHFSSEPGLRDNNIDAKVSTDSVVLTGTVETEEQHERAVRIAQAYAADRQIVDKIKVRQQT